MAFEDVANLATAFALIISSLTPLTIAATLRVRIKELAKGIRKMQLMSLLLGSFLLTHGLYHLMEYYGNDFLSDNVFEPLSVLILMGFALHVKNNVFVPVKKQNLPLKQTVLPLALLPAMLANPFEIFTLFGILFSTLVFAWMAIKNPSTKALHFQFAMITLVWSSAEIPHVLSTLGVLSMAGIETFGLWVHFLSMLLIGVFVSYRSFRLAFPVLKSALAHAEVRK